jgi:glycosyltransferase involved in cell wall biosynthesis
MKIAIVTDAWLPQINGVVTTYTETIKRLEKQGIETTTITPEQFRTFRCPTYPEISLSFVRPATIKDTLSNIAPHSIHIATEGPLGWAARRACINEKFSFTTAYHTRFPEYVRVRFPLPLRLSYAFMRRFHQKGSRMMVSSPALKEELEKKGFQNVCLWSRGVDTQLFKPVANKNDQPEHKTFTYLGRVAPEKNIEAFLHLDLPGRKLVIGDGPALNELKTRFPGVEFTGFMKGKKLAAQLAESDVFVFPSLTDTLGVVQLEAMACGVPVAAFPVDGPRSLISNGYNGWMDEDLRTAIIKCLDIHPQNCRKYAEAYTWEACTKQFMKNLTIHNEPYGSKNHALLARAA